MWGVYLRLKDPLRELISVWCVTGESNFWCSVAHKICATVALSVVITLRAAGPLFRFPVRTDILRIDSASTPFVVLTKPRIQEHPEIFPRGVKQPGWKLVSLLFSPLSKAEVENTRTWKYICSLPLFFMKQCSIKLYNFAKAPFYK